MKRTVSFQTNDSDFAKEFKEGFLSSSENWIESDCPNLRIAISLDALRKGKTTEQAKFYLEQFVNIVAYMLEISDIICYNGTVN